MAWANCCLKAISGTTSALAKSSGWTIFETLSKTETTMSQTCRKKSKYRMLCTSALFVSLILTVGCSRGDEQEWNRLLAEAEALDKEIENVSSDVSSLWELEFTGMGWGVCVQTLMDLQGTGAELVGLKQQLSRWRTYIEEFARIGGSERVRVKAATHLGGMEGHAGALKYTVAKVRESLEARGCVPPP